MTVENERPDQFGENADATSGGGASTDRGGRDAGMPGPAPGSATAGSPRHADPTDSNRKGTEATETASAQSTTDQPARPSATGSAPRPTD